MDEKVAGTTENTQSEGVSTTGVTPDNQATAETAAASQDTLLHEALTSTEDATEQPEEKAVAEGAPEKYEEFKAPDGTTLDAEVVNTYAEVAKELGLSQEKAQGVIDKLAPILNKRQIEAAQAVKTQWREASLHDQSISTAEARAPAVKAVREFIGPDMQFKDKDIAEICAMAGDHPGFIKILKHFGQQLQEDRGVSANTGSKKTAFTPEDFYKGA